MQKKSALWLASMLCVLLALVTACGSNTPTSKSTAVPTVPAGENIYVLDGYTPLGSMGTGQQIVAFHPGSANPPTHVSLPAGLTSLNHQRIYVATPQNGQTSIAVINSRTGAKIRTFVIPGTFSTAEQGYNFSVLSANGQWLALRQLAKSGTETAIALVDTQAGKLVKIIRLVGNFDLDTVNPDGSRIYLLQRLGDASGHYYVRLYNVTENELYQTPIADKSELNDPRMTGLALTRQMSSDGKFAYTLYIDSFHNVAFVHVLPMTDQTYLARCLDLPVGKSADLLRYYTLTLSSDGSTLYAANGALGVASTISLDNNVIFNDQVGPTNHFDPGKIATNSGDRTRMLYNGAALSSDQKTLYFAGMRGVWAVNTADLTVQGHYMTQQAFTGIALSNDNRTLYAVDPANGITLLNAATGQSQEVLQGPARNPWGVEWITD